jgi:hypothetical protein
MTATGTLCSSGRYRIADGIVTTKGFRISPVLAPSMTAGLLQPAELARYRNAPVYIRRSMHVPPRSESVMVQFARNFVVDLANFTPASAEKGYFSAPRFMSPDLLSRFEPVAREQLKQVVTNRVSQFFTADSYKVEGKESLSDQVPGREDNVRG